MVRRQLSDEEKRPVVVKIKELEETVPYLEYTLKHVNLLLEEGLIQNFKLQMKEYTQKKKSIESELKLSRNELSILKNQLVEGIETKK